MKNEWQNFLNLCICQESQLKSVENYKKVKSSEETVGLHGQAGVSRLCTGTGPAKGSV